MQIEMCCPTCFRRVAATSAANAEEMLDQVLEDSHGYALGDGETFEDMISTTLTNGTPQPCPGCGEEMQLCEESLGQLALSLLASM